jgi:adenine specific DNA methylase Mod
MDPPYSYYPEDIYFGTGKTPEEYLHYMEQRFIHLASLLELSANIIIHMDHKMVHYVKVLCDSIFGEKNFKNEVIWGFTGPSNASRWLPRKHQTLLWYGLGEYTFNQPRVPYKANLSVGGKTSWAKQTKDVEEYIKRGKALEDYWIDIPALVRNEPEKIGYPTQKPLKLLERIITIWSNEGDRVLDPFCGSGSFLLAAQSLNRIAIGADIHET